jgi:hypothetical protein
MTRDEAIHKVTERWQRLKINRDLFPSVFQSDIAIEQGCRCAGMFGIMPHDPQCPLSDYREQIMETGRSVPQYSDQAR